MCGRFTLTTTPDVMAQQFQLTTITASLSPRYNIAPSQSVAIITNSQPDHLQPVQWGLIPKWAKDPLIGNKLVNARSESAFEKPSFKSALKMRRCLIPTSGFYEWKTVGGKKHPMFIYLEDAPLFAFAGLWETWENPNSGATVLSCSILTTEANDDIASIHHRMPVIVAPDDYATWLNADELTTQQALMRPFPNGHVGAYEVTREVNTPYVDAPYLVQPWASNDQPSQMSLL